MTETNGEREAIARPLPNVPHLSRGARYINLNVARLLCTRAWSFSLSSRLQASSSCSPLFSISLSWRGVRSLPIYLPACLALHLGYLHIPYLLLIYFIHTHTHTHSISLALWFPFTFFLFSRVMAVLRWAAWLLASGLAAGQYYQDYEVRRVNNGQGGQDVEFSRAGRRRAEPEPWRGRRRGVWKHYTILGS